MFGLHAHEKSLAMATALAASGTPGQPLEQRLGINPGRNDAWHQQRRRIDRDQCAVGHRGAYIGTARTGVKR